MKNEPLFYISMMLIAGIGGAFTPNFYWAFGWGIFVGLGLSIVWPKKC